MQPTPPNSVRRVIRRTQRAKRREKQKEAWQALLPPPPPPVLHAHEDFYPYYPDEDWIDVTEEASHDYLLPTHVTNVASCTTYALAEASGTVLQNAPNNVRQQCLQLEALAIFMSIPTLSMEIRI